jgi:hypothetical protein
MASQKLTNCCVAEITLGTAAYLSMPHSSTIARLAFGFLARASNVHPETKKPGPNIV